MKQFSTSGGRAVAPRRLLLAAITLALTGCATRVASTGSYATTTPAGRPLPRPVAVLVYDFAVDWQNVELDQGLRARLQRQGGSPSQDQQQVAAEVQAAIADTLVDQINAMGLRAVRAEPGTRPRQGDVLVRGQIVKVDGGNATRRNLIGFGAGKSEVYANVELAEIVAGEGSQTLQTYDASSNSGRTPGLGLGAASAAAGHVGLAVAGTAAGTILRARSGLPKDGEDLAKRVAVNLGRYFSGQGWIDPSNAPSVL